MQDNTSIRVLPIAPAVLSLAALAAVLVLPGERLRGQQPLGGQESAESAPAGDADIPAPSDLDSQLLDDLDSQLLEGLEAPPSESAPPAANGSGPAAPDAQENQPSRTDEDPLLDIGRRMRNVERRIAEYDTSSPTQDLQRRIVADLEDLIEQMQKQCSSSADNPSPKNQGGSSPNEQEGGSASGGEGTQAAEQASSRPARDSSDRLDAGRSEKVEGEGVQDLVKQVWGHLPPKVRELMRSASVEEFLPKYEQQIEAYYRRLAEEE